MLDTCCSEAEIPSSAGIKKYFKNLGSMNHHHGATDWNYGMLQKLDINFRIFAYKDPSEAV